MAGDGECGAGEEAVEAALLRDFGHSGLRPGQGEVIRTLLAGRGALAVFPTGGGKSLCYQLPALLVEGLVLVVSPLVALMREQVEVLRGRGIPAARMDSTLDEEERTEVLRGLEEERWKLLYLAPERLADEGFRKTLRKQRIAIAAVDEAHCISEWGHNFRPDYLKLAAWFRWLKVERVLALTATATPKVAADIRRRFRIARADEVRLPFHRPNLNLSITPVLAKDKDACLLDRLQGMDQGMAIVYVTRQEDAERVATHLSRHGLAARAYHAGLHADARIASQLAFSRGELRVMVATIAFGMGIDRPDIRQVIHYHPPKSPESYVQEIGRAGRDGAEARCEWLADAADFRTLEHFIHADDPGESALALAVERVLRLSGRFEISLHDWSVSCDIRRSVLETLLAYLELDGWIEATGSRHSRFRLRWLRPPDAAVAGRPAAERRLLARALEDAEEHRGWTVVDLAAADERGFKRERVAALLRGMAEAGDVSLRTSHVLHGYRARRLAERPGEVAARWAAKFRERCEADLARLDEVFALANQRGCLTARLARRFGERLAEPCGHCDRCRGLPSAGLRRPRGRRPSDEEWRLAGELAAERQPALRQPRQLARFLCGMSSPASRQAGLARDPRFGLLADLPFRDLLALAGAFGAGGRIEG